MKKELTNTEINKENIRKIGIIINAFIILNRNLAKLLLISTTSYGIFYVLNKYFNLNEIYELTINKVLQPAGVYTTVSIIFILGILLVRFKIRQQLWYGVFETFFALISSYLIIKSITLKTPAITLFIAFGTSTYLIVRGLSNITDGTAKQYWCKHEIQSINQNINVLTTESITNILKDRTILVDFIYKIIEFFINHF